MVMMVMGERNSLRNRTEVPSGYDFSKRKTLIRCPMASDQGQTHCRRRSQIKPSAAVCAEANMCLTRRKLFHNSPKHRTIGTKSEHV